MGLLFRNHMRNGPKAVGCWISSTIFHMPLSLCWDLSLMPTSTNYFGLRLVDPFHHLPVHPSADTNLPKTSEPKDWWLLDMWEPYDQCQSVHKRAFPFEHFECRQSSVEGMESYFLDPKTKKTFIQKHKKHFSCGRNHTVAMLLGPTPFNKYIRTAFPRLALRIPFWFKCVPP